MMTRQSSRDCRFLSYGIEYSHSCHRFLATSLFSVIGISRFDFPAFVLMVRFNHDEPVSIMMVFS